MIRNANAGIERSEAVGAGEGTAERAELLLVLANAVKPCAGSALMIAPAMPVAAKEILRQLGREGDIDQQQLARRVGLAGRHARRAQAAVPAHRARAPDRADREVDAGGRRDRRAGAHRRRSPIRPAPAAAPAEIAIDDFAKIDLRVAKVVACERVPKSDKLLKLTLDVGAEPRTVVSGIAAAYQPEQMVGRTVIYLANLKPAKIRGVLSQGMILAAGDAEVLALSALDRDAPPGTRIR